MSVKVEVFASPGCSKCGHAKEMLRNIAKDVGGGRIELREVNVVEELEYVVSLGVLSTPAIAIDGRLAFTGLPPTRKLRAELDRYLAREDGAKRVQS